MKCEQVQERLSEYLENILDPDSYTSVHDHLSSCPHCQAEAQFLAQTKQAVAELPSVEPPPGFSQRVMARVREQAGKPSLWQRLFLPLKIKIPIHAMAILLVGGLAVYLYQVNQPVETEIAKSMPSEAQLTFEQGRAAAPPASPPPPAQEQLKQTEEAASAAPGRPKVLKKERIPAPPSKEGRIAQSQASPPKSQKEAKVGIAGKKLAEEGVLADIHLPETFEAVQTTNYQLIFAPKDPHERMEALTQKLDALLKKVGGQYVQPEETTTRSKQGLATEPQDRFLKPQILWLIIPEDRYDQFKTELTSLGKIEESSIAPERPAGSTATPELSKKAHSPLRIKLILQLPEKP